MKTLLMQSTIQLTNDRLETEFQELLAMLITLSNMITNIDASYLFSTHLVRRCIDRGFSEVGFMALLYCIEKSHVYRITKKHVFMDIADVALSHIYKDEYKCMAYYLYYKLQAYQRPLTQLEFVDYQRNMELTLVFRNENTRQCSST